MGQKEKHKCFGVDSVAEEIDTFFSKKTVEVQKEVTKEVTTEITKFTSKASRLYEAGVALDVPAPDHWHLGSNFVLATTCVALAMSNIALLVAMRRKSPRPVHQLLPNAVQPTP